MNDWLSRVQHVVEAIPIRGKGRLADLLLAGKDREVTCPEPLDFAHLLYCIDCTGRTK